MKSLKVFVVELICVSLRVVFVRERRKRHFKRYDCVHTSELLYFTYYWLPPYSIAYLSITRNLTSSSSLSAFL